MSEYRCGDCEVLILPGYFFCCSCAPDHIVGNGVCLTCLQSDYPLNTHGLSDNEILDGSRDVAEWYSRSLSQVLSARD